MAKDSGRSACQTSLLANAAWWVLYGGAMTCLTDKLAGGHGVDYSVSLTAREYFLSTFVFRFVGSAQVFLGMIPLFVMATANTATLKNLCFAMGIVHVCYIVDYYKRHYAFLVEQDMEYLNVQPAVMALLAVASFAGAGFAMPRCKLTNVTWGPLEIYLAVVGIMLGPIACFLPNKMLKTLEVEFEVEWVRHSIMLLGLFNMFTLWLIPFIVFASNDSAANGKFALAFSLYWAVNLGMVCMMLNSCIYMRLDPGALNLDSCMKLVGLFCALRVVDKAMAK